MVESKIRRGVAVTMGMIFLFVTGAEAQRQMERLGRGMVAIHQGGGKVYVGWRMLATDPEEIAFNVYRFIGRGIPVRLNDQPITQSTYFLDNGVDLARSTSYFVRPVLNGKEQESSSVFTLRAKAPAQP